MSALNEPLAKKIARLLRLFGSDFEGEAVNALMAMKRLITNEGLSFNDIATLIENHQGEIDLRARFPSPVHPMKNSISVSSP